MRNTGTLVGAEIRPVDSLDAYPTFYAEEGRGGYYAVADIAARNAITLERRVLGLRVKVLSENKEYELIGGLSNSNWTLVVLQGYSPSGKYLSFTTLPGRIVTENNLRVLLNNGDIVAPTINLPFTVLATDTPVYISINETGVSNPRKVIFAFLVGEGIWGLGGTSIPTNQLRIIEIQPLTIEDVNNDPNTVTIDLGESTSEDYLADANSEVRDLSNENSNYYFTYTDEGKLYFVQFVGEKGIYGGSGAQLTEEDLIPTTNSGVVINSTLQSVTESGNTTNKDIIHTDESGTVYKNGIGDKQAVWRYVDVFGVELSDPTFAVFNEGVSRYVPLNIGGAEADENGFVDLNAELDGSYIPLSGTTEGNPVAGDVEFSAESGNIGFRSGNLALKFYPLDNYLGVTSRIIDDSGSGVTTHDPESGVVSTIDYSSAIPSNKLVYAQRKYVDNLVEGREDISSDLFISCMLYKYIESPSTYDGRSMYYRYKGEEKYFDISPYVPDRSIFPRLLTNAVFIDGKNIIIQGTTGYNAADHNDIFLLVFKDCYTLNGELKISNYTYKTYTDVLNRDSAGLMYDMHGVSLFNGYLYGNTRIQTTGITAGARTQIIKINPYDLEDYNVITLSDYSGSCAEIQVTKDGVFSLVSTGGSTSGYIIRTDLNLNNVTNLATVGTTTAKRVRSDMPFTIHNGEIYIPTYANTTPSAYTSFGISVYSTVTGKLLKDSGLLTASTGTEANIMFWHWANIYQGKLIMHACTGSANRYIVRVDIATLTLEESRPVTFFSGVNTTKFTNDNSIMPDGYIYFNEEGNPINGKLYRVKYDNFSDFTAITPTGNGGYYYSGGSTDTRFDKDYQSKTLQKVLEATIPNLTTPTGSGTLTTGVRVNSVTYPTGADGIADLGTISGGGSGSTYTATAPVTLTGTAIGLDEGNITHLSGDEILTGRKTFNAETKLSEVNPRTGNMYGIGTLTLTWLNSFISTVNTRAIRSMLAGDDLKFQSVGGAVTYMYFDRNSFKQTSNYPIIAPAATADGEVVNRGQLNALITLSASINVGSNLTLALAMFGKNGEVDLYVNAASASITITLPAANTMDGYKVNVIKIDSSANSVIIKGNGTTNINQANTYPLTVQNQNATIKSNTTQYWIF